MTYVDKNLFLVLSEGLSYLSQNSTFNAKNLAICLKQFSLQNEISFGRKKIMIEQSYYRFRRFCRAVTPRDGPKNETN